MDRSKYGVTILLVAGILIAANVLINQFSLRLDLTEDGQFTLSQSTKQILRTLPEPVTVKAYFSKGLPPDFQKVRRDFQDLLVEYSDVSNGDLVFEFIDPSTDEALEQQAGKDGIGPVLINVREKDQVKQQRAFLGAVVQMGAESEIIPFMQGNTPMEYSLSTAIKKVSIVEKPGLALIQGHGEPAFDRLPELAQSLSVLYDMQPVDLGAAIEPRYETAMLIRPTDTLPPAHLQTLEDFVARGGNLLIAMNRVQGDFQNGYGSALNLGLEAWLAQKGIIVEDNFVADANCGMVTVQQQQGFFRINTPVPFPYLPVFKNFAKHPITGGIEAIMMQFASPVQFVGDSSVSYRPIMWSSRRSASLKAPQYFDVQKNWQDSDYPLAKIPVAAVFEGPLAGGAQSRMVVIGDGDFPVGGGRGQQVQPDNISLLVNAVDWLSDQTGLIQLRTKEITSRPIRDLTDRTRALYKWSNFALPILLVIIYGFIRSQMRSRRRKRLMEESYA